MHARHAYSKAGGWRRLTQFWPLWLGDAPKVSSARNMKLQPARRLQHKACNYTRLAQSDAVGLCISLVSSVSV